MSEKIFYILIFLLIAYKFRNYLKGVIYYLFFTYVVLVLSLWSLPRILTIEQIKKLTQSVELETFYRVQSIVNYNISFIPAKLFPVLLSLLLMVSILGINKSFTFFSENQNYKKMSMRNIFFASGIVLLTLFFLEKKIPFYFVQDDNHAQFFPKTLLALKMLFSGEFPFIDNYQHFGYPIFEEGVYPILDPLMIVSFLASKIILKNIYFTLDCYAILSLVLGGFIFGICLKKLNIESLVGIAAIISYSLLGYFLIAGRSWYYVFGIAFYMPFLFYFFILALENSISWKSFLGLAFVRGAFFYSGNVQFFTYACILEFLSYVCLLFKNRNFKLFLNYCLSLLFTIGIISPLLIPQYFYAKNVPRPIDPLITDDGIPFDGVISSFLPYPITRTPHPVGWPVAQDGNRRFMTTFYHIGFIWVLIFFLNISYFLKNRNVLNKALLIIATIFLFASGGPVSLVYPLKHFIPMINKMHFAFKLYPFAAFLIILFSVIFISRNKFQFKKELIIINSIITIFTAIYSSNTAFYLYSEHPYPPIYEPIKPLLNKDDYIYSFTPARFDKNPFVPFFPHNYSCLYENIMSFNQYETLFLSRWAWAYPGVNLQEFFKNLGITKALIQKIDGSTNWEGLSHELSFFPKIYEDKNVTLYDTRNEKWLLKEENIRTYSAAPLVDIIKYSRTKLIAKINNVSYSNWVYHNEYRPGYKIKINHKQGEIFPSSDGWCKFKLAPGDNLIEIYYFPARIIKSIFISLILIFISTLIFFFFNCFKGDIKHD